jgi:hypothetical protein
MLINWFARKAVILSILKLVFGFRNAHAEPAVSLVRVVLRPLATLVCGKVSIAPWNEVIVHKRAQFKIVPHVRPNFGDKLATIGALGLSIKDHFDRGISGRSKEILCFRIT